MRKKLMYIFLFFICSFISFNKIVNAEEYYSELMPQSKAVTMVNIDKITLENFGVIKYVKIGTDQGTRFEIIGRFTNGFDSDVNVKLKYTFYDGAKNVLKEYNEDIIAYKDYGASYTKVVQANSDGYSIDDVKYYTLEVSVPMEVSIFDGADTGSYFYDNFHSEINVKLNNIYEVNEKFLGKFKGSVRAIDMDIPFRHKYKRADGANINKRAIISDISASDSYDEYIKKGLKVVTIGNAEQGETEKEFEFGYKYNVGKDKIKGNDEVFFYLVNNNQVEINNYTFKINLPQEFDKNNVSFVDGNGNIVDNIEYKVEDNSVIGKFTDVVKTESIYAIKILLPDNYFVNTTLNISNNTWIAFVLPVTFMVLTIVIRFMGKKEKNKKNNQVGLYLDEEVNSLEVGYVLNDGLKETEISSLVFYLANKGYISIESDRKGYVLTKVKEYDGNNKIEETLMKRLFNEKSSVTRKDLKENLLNIKEEIDKIFKYKKNKRFFIRSVFNYKLVFWLMILVIYFVVMNDLLFEYQPNLLLVNVIPGFIGLVIMLIPLTSKKYQLIEKILCVMVGVVLIVSPIMLTSYESFLQDNLYVAAYILGVVCIVSIAVTTSMMNRRTAYGNHIYNKIIDYKSYLVNVSEEEIKEAVKNNSNYFYDVLPYVLIMGMSDKFYEKFDKIELEQPSWYHVNKFNLEDFYTEVKNIYSDFYIALNKRI
ncbi:MAG TPA: hypothetical protein DCE23_10145 [Firmicutes bacterium]|nr:hypothetical protein [Bacillota bacterium]